jgi:SAM-dependent methyltransferase
MAGFHPANHWRSTRALARAREASLRMARAHIAAHRAAAEAPAAVFLNAHEGIHHLELFRQEFPAALSLLPPDFSALEIGAGMGWMAALLAAHAPAARVLATEFRFGPGGPLGIANSYTLYRLAEREPALHSVIRFAFDQSKTLTGMSLSERIAFARASATDLPAADASAHFLYSINCLEHLPDLRRCFGEMARVLRPDGILLHTTEPLFFSPYGHHLQDFFPAPWAHLLWEWEELAELVERETGGHMEWAPGVRLARHHVAEDVLPSLNGAAPADFRRILRAGPWEVLGWVDLHDPATADLAREIGLRDALRGIPWEALSLSGLRMKLRRTAGKHPGFRAPLWLPHTTRATIRSVLPRRSGT